MARELLIQTPDGQTKTFGLGSAPVTVGRSSNVELCFFDDVGLSRQHFIFESEGDDWTVRDLGSKNGTYVNNIPLKARLVLQPGDRITAGHLTILYDVGVRRTDQGVVVFEGGERESPTTSTVGGLFARISGLLTPAPKAPVSDAITMLSVKKSCLRVA